MTIVMATKKNTANKGRRKSVTRRIRGGYTFKNIKGNKGLGLKYNKKRRY